VHGCRHAGPFRNPQEIRPAHYPPPLALANQPPTVLDALWLKKTAARSRDALEHAITEAIDCLTPTDCIGYFTATGYEPE
jgi:hypothetical protein